MKKNTTEENYGNGVYASYATVMQNLPSVPLKSPESIAKYMTEHSPHDKTILPLVFSVLGCFFEGFSCMREKEVDWTKSEDEVLASAYNNNK
jgi:hypothetical protein